MTPTDSSPPRIVSCEEWLTARIDLLSDEKQLTRRSDALREKRRALPWIEVEKRYMIDTPAGAESLTALFDGRTQLIVQHFMLGPGWEAGCVGCSFSADHVDGARLHLEHHDVSFVAISRAPLTEIEAFKKRMGWRFRWVSSHDSDFNYDYHVSFRPEEIARGKVYYNYALRDIPCEEMSGTSVFCQDAGRVYHTYSAYGRGDEQLIGTYNFLDLTSKGRNETGPRFDLTDWVRHHDRYGNGDRVDRAGRTRSAPDPFSSAHS